MINDKISLMESKGQLFNFQTEHVKKLIECALSEQCILDASPTGTGKTYCALKLCEEIGMRPFIVCPKSVITNWLNVSKYMHVPLFGVSNYEKAKRGKYYDSELKLKDGKYISKMENTTNTNNRDNRHKFNITFPDDVLIIFDEAHRCKNWKTSNFGLLLSMKEKNCKIMLLSATISDKIECFKTFGYIFNLFHHTNKSYNLWYSNTIRNIGLEKTRDMQQYYEPFAIHMSLFPKFGSRIDIRSVINEMPQNQISANCYFTENIDEINEQYDEINEAISDLHNKELHANALVRILRARQKIELIKIPIIIDLAREAFDGGLSVVIFVNFNETMKHLCKELECDVTIHGKQTIEERQMNIDDFQNNKKKLIISNIAAGGCGLSLHDIHGGHQRMSIISPTWSGQDLVQCLGRIHRIGSKSIAIQKIIYCAGTYEETVCDCMTNKLRVIKTINDGDITPEHYPKEIIRLQEDDL